MKLKLKWKYDKELELWWDFDHNFTIKKINYKGVWKYDLTYDNQLPTKIGSFEKFATAKKVANLLQNE